MIDHDMQKRLAGLIDRPAASARLPLLSAGLAFGLAIAISWNVFSARDADIAYAARRAAALVAICENSDTAAVRRAVENRIGKPWAQFDAADKASGIDFLLDTLERKACIVGPVRQES